jgi:methionyl-tRNA formyltransferase
LLPLHRGPIPVSWAIRNGDDELGVTFHFMDADLDTGPIVAQRSFPLGEFVEPDEFYLRLGPIVGETLGDALEKLAAGERGTPQEGGTYETFFTPNDVWLDRTRTARELHRLAWAWRYTPAIGLERAGLLVELDGGTARVLRSSLDELDGAIRIDCADGPLWVVTELVDPPSG